jgi:hypothetical protein
VEKYNIACFSRLKNFFPLFLPQEKRESFVFHEDTTVFVECMKNTSFKKHLYFDFEEGNHTVFLRTRTQEEDEWVLELDMNISSRASVQFFAVGYDLGNLQFSSSQKVFGKYESTFLFIPRKNALVSVKKNCETHSVHTKIQGLFFPYDMATVSAHFRSFLPQKDFLTDSSLEISGFPLTKTARFRCIPELVLGGEKQSGTHSFSLSSYHEEDLYFMKSRGFLQKEYETLFVESMIKKFFTPLKSLFSVCCIDALIKGEDISCM